MQPKVEPKDIQTKNQVDTTVDFVNQEDQHFRCTDSHISNPNYNGSIMNNATTATGTKGAATKENTIDLVQRSFGKYKEVMNVTLNH